MLFKHHYVTLFLFTRCTFLFISHDCDSTEKNIKSIHLQYVAIFAPPLSLNLTPDLWNMNFTCNLGRIHDIITMHLVFLKCIWK